MTSRSFVRWLAIALFVATRAVAAPGQANKLILDFPTTDDFDAAQIRFSNTVGTQSALGVFAICVGEP